MQDVTVDGTPIEDQSKSKIAADQAAGAVSLLIRIGHKVGFLPIQLLHYCSSLYAISLYRFLGLPGVEYDTHVQTPSSNSSLLTLFDMGSSCLRGLWSRDDGNVCSTRHRF